MDIRHILKRQPRPEVPTIALATLLEPYGARDDDEAKEPDDE
jgi:hypothetical protein